MSLPLYNKCMPIVFRIAYKPIYLFGIYYNLLAYYMLAQDRHIIDTAATYKANKHEVCI